MKVRSAPSILRHDEANALMSSCCMAMVYGKYPARHLYLARPNHTIDIGGEFVGLPTVTSGGSTTEDVRSSNPAQLGKW